MRIDVTFNQIQQKNKTPLRKSIRGLNDNFTSIPKL